MQNNSIKPQIYIAINSIDGLFQAFCSYIPLVSVTQNKLYESLVDESYGELRAAEKQNTHHWTPVKNIHLVELRE